MYMDCHLNVHVSVQQHICSHMKSFNMKWRQQTMLSFLLTAEKSPRHTSDNNFRNKSKQT